MGIRKFGIFYPLAMLVCMLAATTCVGIQQLRQVEENRRVANEQRNISLSRHLAWEARSFIKDRPDLAMLLAVEAYDTADTTEARASLLEALQSHPSMVRYLHSHTGPVREMAFGAGGVLAFGGHDGDASISLWDSDSGKPICEPIWDGIADGGLATSRDGNILACGTSDGIRMWGFRAQQSLHPPIKDGVPTGILAFGPDGILAAGGGWGRLRLFDSQTGEPLTSPLQAHDEMTHGAFIGGIFLSTNNGASWRAVNSGLMNTSVRCLAVSGKNLFVGTLHGGVFLSTNNGASWRAVNSGLTNLEVQALAVSGTNIFAGTHRGVFLSTNNGTSWTAVNSGLFEPPSPSTAKEPKVEAYTPSSSIITCLAVSGKNLFAGTYRGVFLSTNNGKSWTKVNLIIPKKIYVRCLAVSGTNIFAGTSDYGKVSMGGIGVFLSTDNGISWKAVNSGLPARASVTCLEVSGTNIFAGTDEGVFLSKNNGTSWKAVNSGLPEEISCLAVSGTNLFAGTEYGVYLSTNNGKSWKAANSGLPDTPVHCLAVSGTNLFVGTDGGGWWRTNIINGLVFSPDGEVLLSGADDGIIRRWEGKSLEPAGAPVVAHVHGVASLVFHPDGKTLASGGNKGQIRLWNWPDMKPAGEPIRPYESRALLAYTPDGVLLSTRFYSRGSIRQWNGKTLESLSQPLSMLQGRVLTLAVRDDGMVATGGYDGTVMLWDLKAGNRLMTSMPARAAEGIAFTGGDQLIAAGENGILRYWSIRDRKLVREVHTAGRQEITALAVLETGKVALGLDNGSVQFADPATGNLRSPVRVHDGMIHCLAFNPAGDRLAAGDFISGSLCILDPQSNTKVTPLVNAGLGYLWDVVFSPDGKVLAASGQYGMIRLFDAYNLRPLTPPLQVHDSWGMNFLAFSPDGRLAVAGGSKPSLVNIIQLRNGTTGQPIGSAIETPPVSKLVFTSGGKVLAGSGFDGTVRLWDGRTLQFLGDLTGGEDLVVRHLAASVDGRIAAAFDNGNVEIWDVDITSWKQQARRIANRELTQTERRHFLGTLTSEGAK